MAQSSGQFAFDAGSFVGSGSAKVMTLSTLSKRSHLCIFRDDLLPQGTESYVMISMTFFERDQGIYAGYNDNFWRGAQGQRWRSQDTSISLGSYNYAHRFTCAFASSAITISGEISNYPLPFEADVSYSWIAW